MTTRKTDYFKALQAARGQLALNVREIEENWSPEIRRYLMGVGITSPAAWCAAFCAWCFEQSGGCPWKDIQHPAYVPAIAQWAKDQGLYVPKRHITSIKAGDLALFGDNQHIGIVERFAGEIVGTIEGNTTSSGGGQEGLYRKEHRLSSKWLTGFLIWPVVASQPGDRAITIKLNGRVIAKGELRDATSWGPVAAIAKELGFDAHWDKETRSVNIAKGA